MNREESNERERGSCNAYECPVEVSNHHVFRVAQNFVGCFDRDCRECEQRTQQREREPTHCGELFKSAAFVASKSMDKGCSGSFPKITSAARSAIMITGA
jgi:hypothetical protein